MEVAVVLDPRYKTDLLEYYFRIFYENDAKYKVKSIQKLCYDLLYDYQLETNNDSSGDSQMLDADLSSVGNRGGKTGRARGGDLFGPPFRAGRAEVSSLVS
ncbi:zinc finger BED domain-containing protein RICESLEEPER [Trifolium repens]|nr:zinc finger BED domain-containing protein RICESLEEPER [Trifolium repens]